MLLDATLDSGEPDAGGDSGHDGGAPACDGCGWSCGPGICVHALGVAAGAGHTCAWLASGTVACWGANETYGQLGNGGGAGSSLPVSVLGVGGDGELSGITQVALGEMHGCARRESRDVVCWGGNERGQLGDGSTTSRSTPVAVRGIAGVGALEPIAEIACGTFHSCARLTTGRVACWGRNATGQLGDGTTMDRSVPVQVQGMGGTSVLTDAAQITTGGSHTCALTLTGGVLCWGANFSGQLGDGTTMSRSSPVAVVGVGGSGLLSGVRQVAAYGRHTCALLSTGEVACWGANSDGQLGDDSTTNRLVPTLVRATGGGTLGGVAQLADGIGDWTCARLEDGAVVCWGSNRFGQLGNGTTVASHLPETVHGVDGDGALSGVDVLAEGFGHACAVRDGEVVCWGLNESGSLGDGTTTDRSTPVRVAAP